MKETRRVTGPCVATNRRCMGLPGNRKSGIVPCFASPPAGGHAQRGPSGGRVTMRCSEPAMTRFRLGLDGSPVGNPPVGGRLRRWNRKGK